MRKTRAPVGLRNSEKLQGSIFVPSFQLKVHRTNCKQIALQSSSRACSFKKIYIYIYEMGYCYVKINVHIISAVIQDIHNMF